MAQKTPVSLMNELAKANKLNPEYKVIEESGPAHKRSFTVQLTLGDVGTWEGKATSIRAAKHAAAGAGLEKCGLCMPEVEKPKFQQVNVTPTVELNVLAMKLGKLTQYEDLQPKIPSYQPPVNMGYQDLHQMQHQIPGFHHNGPPRRSPYGMPHPGQEHHYRPYIQNGYHPRSAPPRVPRICCVKLAVGDQEFYGEGRDKQAARKNAASKAVKVMRQELAAVGEKANLNKPEDSQAVVQNDGGENTVSQPEAASKGNTTDVKSEISQVYEIASKRKLQVGFEDVRSSGPPHMKRFVVSATVGEFVTMGEGCKKKDAKQEAAKKMLEELQKLPELPAQDANHNKAGRFVRRGPRIAKDKKVKGEIDPTLNPVSILGQILQRRHEQPPAYELLHEKATLHEREFTMQVTVGQHQAKGAGPNKKEAKKKAAEAMLQLIGFRTPEGQSASAQGEKTASTEKTDAEQKGPFNDTSTSSQPATILGRQLKPGLLPMVPELAKQTRSDMMNSVVAPIAQVKQEPQEPAVQGGLNRAPGAPVVKTAPSVLTSVQKLLHLAEVEGFRVQFTDYPKEREYLTLVTVSSIPPLTCYGSGVTVEAAREEAASNALKPLLQLGLDRSSALKSLEESQGSMKPQPSVSNDITTSDEGRETQTKKD